jgi:hypothetical protein
MRTPDHTQAGAIMLHATYVAAATLRCQIFGPWQPRPLSLATLGIWRRSG